MASGVSRVKTGAFFGTGAALNVDSVGFMPQRIELLNEDGNCDAVWTKQMADASMRKIVDSGAGTTDISMETTNGITPRAAGFSLGADTDLNVDGEKVIFTAYE